MFYCLFVYQHDLWGLWSQVTYKTVQLKESHLVYHLAWVIIMQLIYGL